MYGWIPSTVSGVCQPNITACNNAQDCDSCPFQYVLVSTSTSTSRNLTCQPCNSNSSCQRCLATNTAQCTSCYYGYYLNSQGVCVNCSMGCSRCISLSLCFVCASGYVAQTTPQLLGVGSLLQTPVTCIACVSPCATCFGNPNSCLSCASGFNLVSASTCVSTFNYQINVVFSVTVAQFISQYSNFLNQVTNAMGSLVNNIAVLSIVYGSATVTLQASTNFAPGSSGAVTQQNNLNNLFGNSNGVAGMPVSTFSVNTNGGSNGGSGGIDSTTVTILAVCIPVGVVRKFKSI